MPDKLDKSMSLFAMMLAVCCISHFITHLGPANFAAPAWWLTVGVLIAAFRLLQRPTMSRLLGLCVVQAAHVFADAPFNPDHWLLLFFVNLALLGSAFGLYVRDGVVDSRQWYLDFAPAGRWLFLICYGFAALSKYNTHFLGAASSCATELAEIQLQVSPWLRHVASPSWAGWVTVICESFVPLLLLTPRTRRFGVMLGIVFHTALVISPGIAVFDFSVTVFTMLLLFTGDGFLAGCEQRLDAFRSRLPALVSVAGVLKPWLLTGGASFMILRSVSGGAMYGEPRIGNFTWMLNMTLAAIVIFFAASALFVDRTSRVVSTRVIERFGVLRWSHIAILLLALVNGACPYVGLKTQGSFTMFSNLRTEGGHWNHLLVPQAVRVVSRFQDDLWQVAQIDDPRLQRDFVEPHYLVPAFEIKRAAAKNPDLRMKLIQDGQEVSLDPVLIDPLFAERPNWLVRKLLVFRPVTRDGSAYCGN